MDLAKIVTYVFLIVFGIGLFVFLQGYMMSLDTSAWSFGGYQLITAILPIIPTVFLVCLITIPVYFIVQEVQD